MPSPKSTSAKAADAMTAAVESAASSASGFLVMDDLEMGFLSELLLPEDDARRSIAGARKRDAHAEEHDGDGDDSDAGSTASQEPGTSSSDGGSSVPKASPASKPKPRNRNPEERRARRRAQVAVSARRHRSRKKSELLELRAAKNELSERLARLRANLNAIRPTRAVAAAEEGAMAERLKRRKVEEVNAELRLALAEQRRFFGTLKSIFMVSAVANAAVDMRQLLHTYTHLGTSPWSRTRDYRAICTDRKLDLALQILLRETEGTDFSKPAISTRSVPTGKPSEMAVTAIATYAFEALDLKQTFVSACGAILGCGTEWPQFSAVSRNAQVIDSPAAHIRYGVSSTRYQSQEDGGLVAVESRALTYYRLADNYGVLLWDFADRDDLFPLSDASSVKRDVIGAVLVRRELCADGVERVVYRSICTKVHSFPSAHSLSPSESSTLDRYAQNSQQGAKVCGAVVYNQIHSDIARSLVAL